MKVCRRLWRLELRMGCGRWCCSDRVLFFCSARCLHAAANKAEGL